VSAGVNNFNQTNLHATHRREFFTFPAAILAVIVGKAFWTCRGQIVDTDLWWHLRNAEHMVVRHQFPDTDSYSFSATGTAWIDHSWLSELIYYAGYRALGLRGVFIIFTIAVTLLGIAIFRLCYRRNPDPLAAGIAAIFGGLLAMVGFTPRAQNFGWLCFVAMFAILLRFREERRGPIWFIPPLFCLWINLHAGWPVGVAVFVIMFVAGLVREDIGPMKAAPWTSFERRDLLLTFSASMAALFLNPFSFRLVLYPIDLAFNQRLNVMIGGEWAPVAFNDARGAFVLAALFAVFAFALLSRREWRIDDVLLLLFALYCGLTHIRFLLLTGIVLPPVLAGHFGRISTYKRGYERRILNAAIMFVVAALMVVAFPSEQALREQVQGFFPAGAASHLKAHPLAGRMFNQYEWGGYLEWELPTLQTFIDTRTDLFEYNGVLKDYLAIATFDKTEELLDRYEISYVVYTDGAPLIYLLSKSPRWRCFYRDGQAAIYFKVRDGAAHEVATPGCSNHAAALSGAVGMKTSPERVG
jgi:hypothetical protein